VQYTASGPDLLREIKPAPGTAAVVFANPDFSLAPSQKVAKADDITPNSFADSMAGTEKRGLEGSSFSPLEGTQKECDKLTGLFEAWHWKAESFTGKDASKEALFHVHFPYILHFATHGFFEAADRSVSKSSDGPLSDETTIQIMSDFYEAAHTSGNAPQALAEVQRNWLVRLRTERGLAQAVNLAGPFIMSSQGAP
jgi:CHAT domain-containing protein